MTEEDLALIRERVAAGLGLTYPRVEQLLEALDEAREEEERWRALYQEEARTADKWAEVCEEREQERDAAREAARDMRDTMVQEAAGCLGCPLREMIEWYEKEYLWLPAYESSQAVKESSDG